MTENSPSEAPHPANAAQIASPSYNLPALDRAFLLGDSMRGVRFLLEYAKAEEILREHRIRSTIVVFGSARSAENAGGNRGRWYAAARTVGRIVSERGGALENHAGFRDNVIATGGGPGIMEAANRGAREAGAPSIGFNITLPREQEPNAWTTPELTFRFHYFAMRKMHLAMRANALIVFPGGFGTFDELFELVTLRQTGKAPPIPIVLFDRGYWSRAVGFETLVEEGMIDRRDLEHLAFADDPEGVWAALVAGGVGRHRGEHDDPPPAGPV